MLLILTDIYDVHADIVIEQLLKSNISFYRLNLDVESLKNTYISFVDGTWIIVSKNKKIITSEMISCVWCRRPFVELSLKEMQDNSIDFRIWKNEWNKTLTGLYNSIKGIPWLNPLRKAYKGENKYYQMEIANKIGLVMPETIITNDKNRMYRFLNKHNLAVFKLMTQEVYDLGNDTFVGLYTNIITKTDIEKFGETAENPITLQKYIDKEYEVRYTVIGEDHFVCRIDSQKSDKAKYDWRRYDIAHTPHCEIEAPKEIKNKVSLMLKMLGLEYGALDFIVTPKGEWIFLEINCMGQWLWIEQLTGMPISKSIVKWVINNN